ncbi:hypothetical protein [Lactiplantibacillus plantarum]|uniref:hypothetical protein n=1 Tax=Lactiplantibacillus plantarum TaxID=1590 RepID=UPI00032A4938|nr:hypothetical protein [Lactiplantibacillus plantarum]AGL63542.2 hypothetical protein LBP_cg0796 [Lactiplantibacillus plantarum subsp. plantarum P-8]AOG31913.1 hypothetical protein AWV72_01125 [Lactiplantibacillus plantarum]KZD95935.1 hypothetical protein FBR4_1700 [Lactiplantibacillus plantarum]KZT96263.1 hypothetical protein Nizo2257_1796 [Lactiplantibacillus plantarum]KZT99809.1 hypothetical protein Nizo2258_0704 [Lactiplantibacillus plantarum]
MDLSTQGAVVFLGVLIYADNTARNRWSRRIVMNGGLHDCNDSKRQIEGALI